MMDQKQFAEYLGVNRNQYNRWENQKSQPDIENAWKLKKKLGISLDELFEEQEE